MISNLLIHFEKIYCIISNYGL